MVQKNVKMKEGLSTRKASFEAKKRPKKIKMVVVTIAMCWTAKVRSTKSIERPRLKQSMLLFIFQKPQKEEIDNFKTYQDSNKEEANINSM